MNNELSSTYIIEGTPKADMLMAYDGGHPNNMQVAYQGGIILSHRAGEGHTSDALAVGSLGQDGYDANYNMCCQVETWLHVLLDKINNPSS